MQPRVSIVIPVYNGADFLRDAIESALAQTYPDVEVLVVNDGSTDDGATEAIAKSFGDRIRYFWKPNGHVASALNHGVAQMTGSHISWLSHDDLYLPDKIETQVTAIEQLGPRTVVYGDFETLDVASGEIRQVRLPDTPPERFRWFMTVSNLIHGCTLLVPKTCFEEFGTFNEHLRTTQDYDMWFRIAAGYRFVHLARVAVRARLHPGQGTNQLRGVALQESDALLAGFVEQLSASELQAGAGASIARAYATIAANMKRRGFDSAHAAAVSRARRAAMEEPLSVAIGSHLRILGHACAGSARNLWRRVRSTVAALGRI